MLKVGSAGMFLEDGTYLPLGTQLRAGFYVVDYEDAQAIILTFRDRYPRRPNHVVHSPFQQDVTFPSSDITGNCGGLLVAMPASKGISIDLRISCVWAELA